MQLAHISSFVILFVGVFIGQTHGGLSNRLLEILKRWIQSDCDCAPYLCCSKWGYCGSTDGYCGEGCQSGPCRNKTKKIPESFTITSEMFQCVFPDIDIHIRTRRFQGLTRAMTQMNWKPLNAVEGAILLAHIAYETDGLKTLSEDCIQQETCNDYQSSWCSIQANSNRKYYGRGMLQLAYPCYYYEAGKALGLDLLNHPDLVSQSDKVAAGTAIWFFKESGMSELAQQGHFSSSARRLNKYQCSTKTGYDIHLTRVKIYQKVRKCFGLSETTMHITC